MTPKVVKFTDLEVFPDELLSHSSRSTAPPWSGHWARYVFIVHDTYDDPLRPIDEWIGANIVKRWGIYSAACGPASWTIVIFFEDVREAVLFKLKDGEIAWKDTLPTCS